MGIVSLGDSLHVKFVLFYGEKNISLSLIWFESC